MPLKFVVISNIEGELGQFSNLLSHFQQSRIPIPFNADYLLNWWQKFGSIRDSRFHRIINVLILVAFREDIPVCILPFIINERVVRKLYRIRSLEFLTQSFNSHFIDIIHSDLKLQYLAQIFSFVFSNYKFDLIRLSYLEKSSLFYNAGIGKVFLNSINVVIPLNKTYDEIREKIYSKNLRHILNKFQRRIRESKDKIVSRIFENRDDILALKSSIRQVSLTKLSQTKMHSIFSDFSIGEKYFQFILDQAKPFCSAYFANAQLVAYNIGYIRNNRIFALDASYSRDYSHAQKIGFGILAYDQLVKHFANSSIELDMGFGLDDYKFRFSKQLKASHMLIGKGNTVISKIVYCYYLQKQKRLERNLLSKIPKNHNVEKTKYTIYKG